MGVDSRTRAVLGTFTAIYRHNGAQNGKAGGGVLEGDAEEGGGLGDAAARVGLVVEHGDGRDRVEVVVQRGAHAL